MTFIDDQVLEATEEYLQELSEELFESQPLLESFGWDQGIDGDEQSFAAEEFFINNGSYFGEDRLWREDICNRLRWAFDLVDVDHLIHLYGKNVRVTVTRYETEVTSLG